MSYQVAALLLTMQQVARQHSLLVVLAGQVFLQGLLPIQHLIMHH